LSIITVGTARFRATYPFRQGEFGVVRPVPAARAASSAAAIFRGLAFEIHIRRYI
jgi:hypothetical protein